MNKTENHDSSAINSTTEVEGGHSTIIEFAETKPAFIDPYRILQRANPEEKQTLKDSIEAFGIKHKIIIDEFNNVIDGHERRDACVELGIDWREHTEVRSGLNDFQKKSLVIELNLRQRQFILTKSQKDELLEIYLIANDKHSDGIVASLFGIDPSTVNRKKKALVQTHKLSPAEKTIGKDGVVRKIGDRKKNLSESANVKKWENKNPPIQETIILERDEKEASQQLVLKKPNKKAKAPTPQKVHTKFGISDCHISNMKMAEGIVDLILSDLSQSEERCSIANFISIYAKKWVKDDGLVAILVRNEHLAGAIELLSDGFEYCRTIAIKFPQSHKKPMDGKSSRNEELENWRPLVVFCNENLAENRLAKSTDLVVEGSSLEDSTSECWRLTENLAAELVGRLSRPGDVIFDPFVREKAIADASTKAVGRKFIGCVVKQDLDEEYGEEGGELSDYGPSSTQVPVAPRGFENKDPNKTIFDARESSSNIATLPFRKQTDFVPANSDPNVL